MEKKGTVLSEARAGLSPVSPMMKDEERRTKIKEVAVATIE